MAEDAKITVQPVATPHTVECTACGTVGSAASKQGADAAADEHQFLHDTFGPRLPDFDEQQNALRKRKR